MALGHFAFRNLGEMQAKGFDRPDRVYALLAPLPAGSQPMPAVAR
jgi:hypothetical protein